MGKISITEVPKELVEVLGNFIRKTAYTQLSAERLVGIGISEDSDGRRMCLSTNPVENTTTVLDVMTKLVDCKLKGSVNATGKIDKNTQVAIRKEPFTNLKEVLGKYIDTSSLPDDLLITQKQHVLKLAFMQVDHDMGDSEIRTYFPDDDTAEGKEYDGIIPIPCTVLSNFKLDYSQKDNGVLSFEIPDEFETALKEKLNQLKDLLVIS